jgi:hypothetical protein
MPVTVGVPAGPAGPASGTGGPAAASGGHCEFSHLKHTFATIEKMPGLHCDMEGQKTCEFLYQAIILSLAVSCFQEILSTLEKILKQIKLSSSLFLFSSFPISLDQ